MNLIHHIHPVTHVKHIVVVIESIRYLLVDFGVDEYGDH